MSEYEEGQTEMLRYLKAQTMVIIKSGKSQEDILLDLINLLLESQPFKR